MTAEVMEKFKALRLKHCAENITEIIGQAEKNNLSCLQAIGRLLDIELEERTAARIALRFKQSKLTEKTTIDQFDFDFHSSCDRNKKI